MARYAIVKSGKVSNVIEASGGIAAAIAAETGSTAVQADGANLGDDWDGSTFTPAVVPQVTPDQVTRYQFTEAAEATLGVNLAAIDAAIADMPAGRPKRRMQAWWQGSFIIRRKGQRMNALQTLMGWDNAQVRDLFRAAAEVQD